MSLVKAGHSQAVPYFDNKRQYRKLQAEIEETFKEAAASGQYVLGARVEEFEKAFADYCGTPYAAGVNSGTDALILALKAIGIGKGDEVIVPSFTFCATVFAILHVQAQPVFAEVEESAYTVDPSSVDKLITKRTRAILPVHLYGQAADMQGLAAIAKRKKLKIIEDACQSHGAEFQGKKTGSWGDAGCFSFYPTKNLGALGDGGAVTLKSTALNDRIRRLRNLGRKTMQEPHSEVAWTTRLDALQAAFLKIKLKHLDTYNDNRRRAAAQYKKELRSTPLILPAEAAGRKHVYHLFVVRVPGGKRDALKNALAAEGIGSMVHYPLPVHRLPVCKPFVKKKADLKLTDCLPKEILSLPMFPEMTAEEVSKVGDAVRRFYR
jgi:dTDP-4-amino-4,6-dideoxygalactose transaminase